MTSTDPSDGTPAPSDGPQRSKRLDLRRKVSLKFKEFQGFVNEYSENVSTGGMFIRTPSPQPPGSVFDFEFTLGDGYTLIHGIGEVVWVRDGDEGFDRPAGMGVRFLSLDPDSRKLIDRMVKERIGPAPSVAPVVDPDRPWGQEASTLETGGEDAWGEPAPEASSEALPSLWKNVPESESPSPAGPVGPADPAGLAPRPSPYAYARSYRGSGVAHRDRSRRPLLLILLAAAVLVAALAAFFLFFPESAVHLLMGTGGDEERLAEAARPEPGTEAPEGPPVEPVPRAEAEAVLGAEGVLGGEEAGGADQGGEGEAAGEEEPELGFFAPAPENPEPPPQPVPAPPPAPRPPSPTPAPEPEPETAAPGAFSRVLNIVWEDRGDEVLVTVHLDGTLEEWDYSTVRIQAPPRELVRIEGITHPFPRTSIPVGTDILQQIRVGYHPEARRSQLHVVLDLATSEAELDRTEAEGTELRLYVARHDG